MKIKRSETREIVRHIVKATRPFLVNGEIVKAGRLIEVSNYESNDLIHRGLASVVTEDELTATQGVIVASASRYSENVSIESERRSSWVRDWKEHSYGN